MLLLVERDTFTPESTEGTLYIDGVQFCWTLELPVRDGLPGSAIPVGIYNVSAYPSPKFGRLMPLLDVPGRSNIEVHWGNTPEDTNGCILLGGTRPGKDFIGDSRQIFDEFWAKTQGAIEAGYCQITIEGTP
jgi:hypothetical protein